jgi:hypothetical protein
MSYAKCDLRHRIRLALTQAYDIEGRFYDIVGRTYDVAATYDIVGQTSYVTSHVRHRTSRYGVAYTVIGQTYDVVGDLRRRMWQESRWNCAKRRARGAETLQRRRDAAWAKGASALQ